MTEEPAAPRLSLVIAAFEMQREVERTVRSLSPPLQRGLEADEVELIVIDNGSSEAMIPAPSEEIADGLRWIRVEDAPPSPAHAMNLGLAEARAPLVGAMIDGARLASPGLLASALEASGHHPRPVIASLGFHLGPDLQTRSSASGYDRAAEDELLERVRWSEDPYRLFEISVPAASSRYGWYEAPAESNALFMPAELWRELGGFDEGFTSPGGGLVNLDLFARACELPDSELITLVGEGTFHQIHGGVATNAGEPQWEEYQAEYSALRGGPWRFPERKPTPHGAEPSAPAGPWERKPS